MPSRDASGAAISAPRPCGPTSLWRAAASTEAGGARRLKLDAAPWTLDKLKKRVAKHVIWFFVAWWTGGAWVLYFADAPTLVVELATFQASYIAYLWIGILTFTTYTLACFM